MSKKLTLRLIFLMILVAFLIALPHGSTEKKGSAAVLCCSSCSGDYDTCTQGCPPSGTGHFTCLAECLQAKRECEASCDLNCGE
jgi:hypothetical protein